MNGDVPEAGSRTIVGVIGGMGPEATVEFFARLTALTPARRDQDHLHVIIDSQAGTPDRTEAIFSGSSGVRDAMLASARRLETAGAGLLAMPCNSAHYWYEEVAGRIGIPFLNMIAEVFAEVRRRGPGKVGLLATTGTARSGVYERWSGEVELLLPDEAGQEAIHEAIYTVKGEAGGRPEQAKEAVLAVVSGLRNRGAEGIILGCTEIPLVVGPADIPDLPVFDSTDVLVAAVLRDARL